MVRTREKRSQVKSVTDLNYLPLLVQYFGPVRTAKLLGFLLMWHVSGEPELADLTRVQVLGFKKSVVYKWHGEVQEWVVWLGERNYHFEGVSPTWDAARAVLREAQSSTVVDKGLQPLLT